MSALLDGCRLLIAYNPKSSRASEVQAGVFDRLDAAGYAYDTVEVLQASLDENIAHLSAQLQSNDIVLCAAGDGSAHAVAHAIIASEHSTIQVGFLAYGNFNDLPRTLNSKVTLRDPVAFLESAQIDTLYPLVVEVNDQYLRHALLYVTIGWTAKAAQRFDQPDIRHQIQTGRANMAFNLWKLGIYYFKSRRQSYLPPFVLDDRLRTRLTDILCVNGPRLARMFKTGRHYYRRQVFLYKKVNVRGLVWNLPFLLRSMLLRMPGKEKMRTTLEFVTPSAVPLQCDGEVVELQDVAKLRVKKARTALSVLSTKR